VNLTAEQRTRIQQTVLSGRDVPRADRVDFAISVGTTVPTHVRIVEVPAVLIQIHPEWRGHRYFVVRDEIVIVDSGHRIVATLPVGSSSSVQIEGGRGGQAGSDTEITPTSDEIRQLQIVLKEKGFDIGEPDGVFGQRTRQALIVFQQRNGLQATGRIDVRTTTALGISTRSGQQGNQAPGNQQPTTGQAGNPQQPGGNQPSANQSSDPSMNRGQNNQGGNQPGTTGQGRDNMQQQQPSAHENDRSGNTGSSSPMNQNNPSSDTAPKSGGQSK